MRRPAPRYLALRLSWVMGAWTNMSRTGNRLTKELSSSGILAKRTMTVKELAIYIGIPIQRIYVLTHTKAIPFIKLGSTVLFELDAIDQWLDSKRVPVDVVNLIGEANSL